MLTLKHVSIALLLSLLAGSEMLVAQDSAALSHDGRLVRVVAATYGELFTDGEAAEADTPVLALESLSTEGEGFNRELVPGTANLDTELEPRLFQDLKYDISILMWRSQTDEGATTLHFSDFDGASWSDVHTLELDGMPLPVDSTPLIAETLDTFDLELDEETTFHAERRTLHLLWQTNDETPETYYVPLNFVEGRYLGWHGVVVLDDAFLLEPNADDTSDTGDSSTGGNDDGDSSDSADDAAEPITLAPTLHQTLDLQIASDSRSVLVTFANHTSQRLGTVEIRPLPLELGFLGDQIRDQLWTLADLYDPEDPTSISDEMRASVIVIGSHFNMHEAYREYVANQVANWIMESAGSYGWSGFENFGNDARSLAIDVSNEVFTSTTTDPADPDSEIVEINIAGLLGTDEAPDPTQTVDVVVRSNLPAPEIGEGPTGLYTSRCGDRQLVAWYDEEGSVVLWRESRSDGSWSEPFSLAIDDTLTVEEAHQLLAAKAR